MTQIRFPQIATRLATPLALACSLLAGCAGTQHLGDYSFTGKTVAVVYDYMPSPVLLTGVEVPAASSSIQSEIESVLHAGTGVAKDIEGAHAQSVLDSTLLQMDLQKTFSDPLVERASRYLGTETITDPKSADFLIEVRVIRSGIDLRSSQAGYLFMDGQATIIEARTGREVWSSNVHGYDRMTTPVYSDGGLAGSVAGDVMEAASLKDISVTRMRQLLNDLSIYSADCITDQLRTGLAKIRN